MLGKTAIARTYITKIMTKRQGVYRQCKINWEKITSIYRSITTIENLAG